MKISARIGLLLVLGVAGAGCSAGDGRTSSARHALLGAPIISPTSGKAGDTISISGTNLGDTLKNIFFPGTTVGGTDWIGDSFTRVGPDEVTVKVPLAALSGRLWGGINPSSQNDTYLQLGDFTVNGSGAPTISNVVVSLNPAFVTVTGTNFTGTTQVAVGGVPLTKYFLTSDTELWFFIPPLSGTVTITNSVGNATSATSLTYVPAAVVTSVSPKLVNEGSTITLTGTNLDQVTELRCNNRTVNISTQSATTITLAAPIGMFGCALELYVTVFVGSAPYVLVVPTTAPTAASYTPTSGSVGTGLTITGTNLGVIAGVEIDGQLALGGASTDGTTYYVQVPAGVTAGVVKVRSQFGAIALAPNFSLDAPGAPEPRIDSVSPRVAMAGDTITITGANFPDVAMTAYLPFYAGPAPASVTRVNATTLTLVAPTFDYYGEICVDVGSYPCGGYVEPLQGAPTLSDVTPLTVRAGDDLTLTGTGLLFASAVRIGSLWLPLTSHYQTAATVMVPIALAGTLEVEVVTPTGSAILSKTFVTQAKPAITSFSPTTAKAGDTVTIVGTDLDQLESLVLRRGYFPKCSGACDASCLCIGSPTSASFIASAEGRPVLLRGRYRGEEVYSAQPLTVSDGVPPIITYVSNTTPGDRLDVTIFGDHFAGVLSVEVGGQAVEFQLLSNDAIHLDRQSRDPVKAGKIKIVTVAGSVESAQTVAPQQQALSGVATITSVTPSEVTEGDTVVILGSGLSPFTGYTSRQYNGGSSGETTVISDTEVRVLVPRGMESMWLVSPNSNLLLPLRNKALAAPQLVGITPSTLLPGEILTIVNSGFVAALEVGGQLWGPQSLRDQTSFYVPFDAISGAVVAKNQLGSSSPVGTLTVPAVATAMAIAPSAAAPGQKVAITGPGAGDQLVRFGSGPEIPGTRLDANTLEVTIPASAPTGAVRVGPFASTPELRVTAAGLPEISSVVPTDVGYFEGRDVVGRNFTGTRRVSIGGVSLTFEIVHDQQLHIELPSSLSNRPLVVENAMGRTVSGFSLTAERPSVTSISTTTANVDDVVTITGTKLNLVESLRSPAFGEIPVTPISATQLSFVVRRGMPTGPLQLMTSQFREADRIEATPRFVVDSPGAPVVDGLVNVTDNPVLDRSFGAELGIRGANFTGLTEVTIGGVPASWWWVASDTFVRFELPIGAPSGPIVLKNSVGQVTAGQYTTGDQSGPLATLTKTTPALSVPLTRVVFEGTNLDLVQQARVGGVQFSPEIPGKERSLFEIPPELASGEIELVMLDGRVVKTGVHWTTLGRLAIVAATPSTVLPGEVITITGDGFLGATDVMLGGVPVTFDVKDNQTIEITTPANGASGPIVVTVEGEVVTSGFSVSAMEAPDMTVLPDLGTAPDLTTSTDAMITDDASPPDLVDGGTAADLMTKGKDKGGCTVGGGVEGGAGALWLLALAWIRRRRQAAVR